MAQCVLAPLDPPLLVLCTLRTVLTDHPFPFCLPRAKVDFAEFVRFMEIQKQKIDELRGDTRDAGPSMSAAFDAGANAAMALGKGVFSLGKGLGKMGMGMGKQGLGMAKKGLEAGVNVATHKPSGSKGAAGLVNSGSAAMHSAVRNTVGAVHTATDFVKSSAQGAATVLKDDALDDLGYVRSSSSSSDDEDENGEGGGSANLSAQQLEQTLTRQVTQFCGAFEEFLLVHCAEHDLDSSGVQGAMMRVLSTEVLSSAASASTNKAAPSRNSSGFSSTSTRRASQAKFLKRGLQVQQARVDV